MNANSQIEIKQYFEQVIVRYNPNISGFSTAQYLTQKIPSHENSGFHHFSKILQVILQVEEKKLGVTSAQKGDIS